VRLRENDASSSHAHIGRIASLVSMPCARLGRSSMTARLRTRLILRNPMRVRAQRRGMGPMAKHAVITCIRIRSALDCDPAGWLFYLALTASRNCSASACRSFQAIVPLLSTSLKCVVGAPAGTCWAMSALHKSGHRPCRITSEHIRLFKPKDQSSLSSDCARRRSTASLMSLSTKTARAAMRCLCSWLSVL